MEATEAPSRKTSGRATRKKTAPEVSASGATELATAPSAPADSEAQAPVAASSETPPTPAKSKRAGKGAARAPSEEPREPEAAASPGPAKPARTTDPQYLILTGGSPFLRAIGSVRRADGEPLPGFVNLTVTKMSALMLPTEPGAYEFRFQASNGTGDFKLAQRSETGAPRNVRDFEMASSGGFQLYRFTIS